jgi:hypothetical protein
MAKVVGLSGAQGAGKSSILTGLMSQGWSVDGFRVSRAVQAQLGWDSLNKVMEDPDTMTQFQMEVYRQKFERDMYLKESNGSGVSYLIVTERTFADIIAYTMQWTWRHVDEGKWTVVEAMPWLTRYLNLCVEAQAKCYDAVMLLPYMDSVPWQEDPNRAERATVDAVYEDVERFLEKPQFMRTPVLTITEKGIPERVKQVSDFLLTL